MDPNNPGQNPGEAQPPAWGPPPAPDQPGYGAPSAPYGAAPQPPYGAAPQPPYGAAPQPPYGAAPQPPYGAPPQPPYGAPPQPPYGAPQDPYGTTPPPYGAPQGQYGTPPTQWGAPAPTAPKRGGLLKKILLAVGVVVVVIVALGVAAAVLSPDHAGQVVFTTDAPTDSGAATCQLGNQVTSVTAGSNVYANFFYKSRLSNETVTRTIYKDGAVFYTDTLSADETNGIDCVESSENLNVLEPGVYEFKLTIGNGDVVSDGTLTVK